MDWHIIIPMAKNAGTNEEIGDKIGEKNHASYNGHKIRVVATFWGFFPERQSP